MKARVGSHATVPYPRQGTEERSSEPHITADVRGWLPTILVVAEEELLDAVVPILEGEGYLVLVARNEAEALRVVVTHSRSIHILLVDANIDGQALASELRPYRSEMKAFLMSTHAEHLSSALNPTTAAAKPCVDLPADLAERLRSNEKVSVQLVGLEL